MNFFKAIGNFLNACVDYIELRVLTGRFIGDLSSKKAQLNSDLTTKSKAAVTTTIKSKPSRQFNSVFLRVWNIFLKFSLFENFVTLVASAIKLLILFYAEIFLVFAMTLPLVILLLYLFEASIITFFVLLIPVLLLILYSVSALYYCIEKRTAGEKIAIWQSLKFSGKHIMEIGLPFLTQLAIICETTVIYFAIILLSGYLFELAHISWEGSFLYWLLIIFLGILLVIGLFLLTIITHQAYFSVLFRQKTLPQSFRNGWEQIKSYPFQYFFFYILLYLTYLLFAWRITLSYLLLGIAFSLFLLAISGILLGYLLQKKFPPHVFGENASVDVKKKSNPLFAGSIIFGMICYCLVGILVTRNYHAILAFVQQQQDNYLAAQEIKTYTNVAYRYTLSYPQNWTIYLKGEDTVTFYNNYTGSVTGGTWLAIKVSPYDANFFTTLFQASPGIVVFDPRSKNITTKISNITVDGYDSINYTFIKNGLPYNQYETHYLVHKDAYLYDLTFIALTNDVQGYNGELFQKIINSFRFIE